MVCVIPFQEDFSKKVQVQPGNLIPTFTTSNTFTTFNTTFTRILNHLRGPLKMMVLVVGVEQDEAAVRIREGRHAKREGALVYLVIKYALPQKYPFLSQKKSMSCGFLRVETSISQTISQKRIILLLNKETSTFQIEQVVKIVF